MSLRFFLFAYFHVYVSHPSGFFHSGLKIKIFDEFPISHMRATCPPHVFLHNLIIQIIFVEEFNL
jgi:hypothetical protein